jgi:hypothetical protein
MLTRVKGSQHKGLGEQFNLVIESIGLCTQETNGIIRIRGSTDALQLLYASSPPLTLNWIYSRDLAFRLFGQAPLSLISLIVYLPL